MYDIFGQIGCTVYAMSMHLHARLIIVGGFGMAIFRIVCIENLAKQIEGKNLAKIIHLVEFVVILMVTITIMIVEENYSLLYNPNTLHPFCKDYGLTKIDIFQTYYEYYSENEEFGE